MSRSRTNLDSREDYNLLDLVHDLKEVPHRAGKPTQLGGSMAEKRIALLIGNKETTSLASARL